jgi:nucleoside-diphosphate-sugar epimerase
MQAGVLIKYNGLAKKGGNVNPKASSKIIILGGNGFIGKELQKTILNEHIAGELFVPSHENLNLLDFKNVCSFFNNYLDNDVTLIILATRVPYSIEPNDDFKTMMQNIDMAVNIVNGLLSNSCKEIIYISTIDVYQASLEPITETTPLFPRSNYSASKISAEMILRSFTYQKNIPFLVLRPSQVFGVNDNSPKVIPKFIKSALLGNKIIVDGTGESLRDWVNVTDVAKIISMSIGRRINDVINIATGNSVSVLDAARIIQDKFTKEVGIEFRQTRKSTVNYRFTVDKLKKYYSYDFDNFKNELGQLVKYYEDRRIK